MTKLFETKRRILDLLKYRKATLTELSHSLNLAPSTVSQHLKELLDSREIRNMEDSTKRKWKYYEITDMAIKATIDEMPAQRRKVFIEN